MDFCRHRAQFKISFGPRVGQSRRKDRNSLYEQDCSRYRPHQEISANGLAVYPLAVGNVLGHQGERVDYAQLIKIYTMDVPEGARRYSPPRLAEAIPTPIYGDPDGAKICTSHVERQNLTMRMCMRRLTRLTNAFSKKWSNLKAALSLHFAYYNFCRRHMSLKGATPAMAAGLTDRVWGPADLLG